MDACIQCCLFSSLSDLFLSFQCRVAYLLLTWCHSWAAYADAAEILPNNTFHPTDTLQQDYCFQFIPDLICLTSVSGGMHHIILPCLMAGRVRIGAKATSELAVNTERGISSSGKGGVLVKVFGDEQDQRRVQP